VVVARSWVKWGMRNEELLFSECRVFDLQNEKVLESGCTLTRMYLTPLTCMLKIG
jgi:hypothetical protein